MVPFGGTVPFWVILNLIFGGFGYWYYLQIRARFPDALNPRDKAEFIRDPSCGTSRWMDKHEADEVLSFGYGSGILLGTMDGEPVRLDTDNFNRNIIVFGSPGSRKTRSLVVSSILQSIESGESCVTTDPKGEVLRFTLDYVESRGYNVKVFDLVNMSHSDRWNPLSEIVTDLDAQLFSEVVIANTAVPGIRKMGGDPFWTRAEQNLLKALVLYVINQTKYDKTLSTLYSLLSCGSLDQLDIMFSSLEPDHPARAPYNIFSQADKPVKSGVIIGLGTRLQVIQNDEVKILTSVSDIDMTAPGLEKCAFYGIVSDKDSTFDFLANLFFTFLFFKLTQLADARGGPCPIKVNFILDEFCNIGSIPDFKKRIATIRSRGLACTLITQSVPQLKNRYPDDEWQEIVSCCDSRLLFGANDPMTARYFSDLLGVGTVNRMTRRHKVTGIDPVILGHAPSPRNLLTPDEILRLDRNKAVLCLASCSPAMLDKLDFTKHPKGQNLPDGSQLERVIYYPSHLKETPPPIEVKFPDVQIEEPMIPIGRPESNSKPGSDSRPEPDSKPEPMASDDVFDPFQDPFAPELDSEHDSEMDIELDNDSLEDSEFDDHNDFHDNGFGL